MVNFEVLSIFFLGYVPSLLGKFTILGTNQEWQHFGVIFVSWNVILVGVSAKLIPLDSAGFHRNDQNLSAIRGYWWELLLLLLFLLSRLSLVFPLLLPFLILLSPFWCSLSTMSIFLLVGIVILPSLPLTRLLTVLIALWIIWSMLNNLAPLKILSS